MEIESIPQAARERIGQIARADLVVGVFNHQSGAAPGIVRQALEKLPQVPRTVIIQGNSSGDAVDTHMADGSAPSQEELVFVVPWALLVPETSIPTLESTTNAYESVLVAGEKLGVQAACILASDMQTLTAQSISLLVQPVLQFGFDLVTPCFAHGRFEGLLNDSLISPLSRALYGTRLHNPMGPDFGISRRLFQRMMEPGRGSKLGPNRTHPLASIAATAICNGFKIGQAHVGVRVYPPIDLTNLSSLLVQVLAPIFLDMERNAVCWQRPRESISTSYFGERPPVFEDKGAIEIERTLESFRLGARELQEVWSLILPPTALLELRKLARLPREAFRMPDELWVRALYDFALGYRLRTINREHLLRALTPLYLGWIASYALELENATVRAAEQRFERLGQVFEATKPYLVSRWRWPDRFNP